MSIKLGFVSADFYKHSAARSWGCLLENYDKEKFHITCYANNAKQDSHTAHFKNKVDSWRWINGQSTGEVCRQIKEDQIDILVDLSGHTVGNRLAVFAQKPAPIQVTGLGFCHTTGLKQMDYIFCDKYNIPPELAGCIYEVPLYLPSFIHWQPPEDLPDFPMGQPCKENGFITFGSGNNLFKHNEDVIKAWAQILKEVPESRLRIKCKPFDDYSSAQHYYDLFEKEGINKSRVDLIGSTSHADHLLFYNSIDIVLDPFPYQGGITTCEALWMGKPVVALNSGTLASVSVLKNVGIDPPLTIEVYINWARNFAELLMGKVDPEVAKLHDQELERARIISSPICNTQLFTQTIYQHLAAIYAASKKEVPV